MRQFMKLIVMILCILAMILTGCSSQQADQVIEDAGILNEHENMVKGSFEFVNWMIDDPEALNYIIERFNEDYPGIEVNLTTIPFNEMRSYILSRNAAGIHADVYQLNMPWATEFVGLDILKPMDDLIEKDESFRPEDMIDEPMRPFDGGTYMIPLTAMHFVLYCNRAHFEQAGLALPESWEDMMIAAEILTDSDKDQYGYAMSMSSSGAENGPILSLYPLLYSAGGRTIKNDQPNIQSEEMLMLMTFIDEMYDKDVIAPGTLTKNGQQVIDEFASGRAAMMIQPSTHIATIRKKNPSLDFDVVQVPGPQNKSFDATRLHGWELGIGANSDKTELAWLFITWLTSPENNGWIAERLVQMPANLRADTSYLQKDEVARKTYAMMRNLDHVEELMFTPNSTDTWRVFTDHTQKMFLDEESPEEAIEAIQREWEVLFSE